jgi:hypothetical protein
MGGKRTYRAMLGMGLGLATMVFLAVCAPRASAELTVFYGSSEVPVVNVNLGETRTAPVIKHNGTSVSSGANYVWSSSDTGIASLSSTNRQIVGNSIGTASLTVTYQGETASVPVKVAIRTLFTEPPARTGIPLLGLTLGANGGQLVSLPTMTPIADAPVTFYENIGGNEICSAITDQDGNASCITVLVGYEEQVYMYFAGDDTYSPVGKRALE